MIPLHKNKIFINLDDQIDLDNFFRLEDEFYQLFSTNYYRSSSVWASGGLDLNSNHEYFKDNKFLYSVFHSNDFTFDHTTKFENNGQGKNQKKWTEELAIYLQLKYNAINPYRFLHLINHDNKDLHDWVHERPQIVEFIKKLPFESFSNISLIFTPKFIPQGYHRDFNLYPFEKPKTDQLTKIPELNLDVVWCRFNLDREFYLYDIDDQGNILEELPFKGYFSMFNHFNWHGNLKPAKAASLTVKFEGTLYRNFKQKIFS